jgi:anti-sigma regulatory factor (Ser/Thr protein kinase)
MRVPLAALVPPVHRTILNPRSTLVRVFRSRQKNRVSPPWRGALGRRLPGMAMAIAGDDAADLVAQYGAQADAGTATGAPSAVSARTWSVEMPGVAGAVMLLRHWVQLLLVADAPHLAEALALIVSEYGTNALWHSGSGAPGGRIKVDLALTSNQIRLTVLDDGPPTVPSDWAPDCLGDHGRGLALVSAYADDHGHDDTPEGHVAWAVVYR